ncbi:MAG TPA: hypothetical protein PLV15_07645 [Smithella sp.]|nr:hypothetical protein [Smithella sp.]
MMANVMDKYFNMRIILCVALKSMVLLLQACSINQVYLSDSDEEDYSAEDITDQEMMRVAKVKLQSTGMVKRAFDIEERHRKLTLRETRQLLKILSQRFKKSSLSVGEFEDLVLERIGRDLEIISAFNERLKNAEAKEKDHGYELCKKNELLEVIKGSEDIVEEYIEDMVNGILPEEFETSLSEITRLERTKEDDIVPGSFKPTCFKGALITMLVALRGDRANVSALKLSGGTWSNSSIIFHTIPMPGKISRSSIHPDFESFTYYYKGASSPSQGELGFPHSGYYAIGYGARKSSKGIANPEDCSSWIFHQVLQTQYPVTSYDVMQFFRIKTGTGIRHTGYAATPEYGWLNSVFIPVEKITKKNARAMIKPGYVLCIRRPDEDGKVIRNQNYGVSGHMAIALFATDTHIYAVACTRDVPLMEGIGIQKISFWKERNSDIMILRMNK